jgi:cyclohexa-1,5-dienecarbonyl-CoA hydratase
MTAAKKARLEFDHEGQVARVILCSPKGNIIDQAMMGDLELIFEELATRVDLKAIVLIGEGPTFSFGASVQEHLPEQIGETLTRLHALLRHIAEAPAPTIAAVRGRCLGGGLELALACDLILAEETALLGCPEIQLGVFPPSASAFLPVRMGTGPAAALVLGGASLDGKAAAAVGLVNRTAAPGQLDTELAEWLAAEFLSRSPIALRCAARAIRRRLLRAMEEDLPELERMYLQDLMSDPDAVEGIRAFLEKRQPRWHHSGVTV